MPASTVGQDKVFISWAPFCSRSDSIIRHLGGTSYMVYFAFFGSNYFTILFKYFTQAIKTLWILFRDRPRVVFVMTPPIIACVPVWLYTRLTGASYLIDAHSGALINQRWQSTMFLHRFFSRRALATIVTNSHLQQVVRSWGANAIIVSDVPVFFAEPRPTRLDGSFNVTFISTFTPDEPLPAVLGAAQQLPEVRFHVTGRLRDANPEVVSSAPANVRFTDFLSGQDYVGLLLASDAVMCLTTREHTMQRGAYEAIYLEKPVVVSDTKLLRSAFYKGSVFVENTEEGIAAGIREMRAQHDKRQQEARQLRQEKLNRWAQVQEEFSRLFNESACSARA